MICRVPVPFISRVICDNSFSQLTDSDERDPDIMIHQETAFEQPLVVISAGLIFNINSPAG